MKELNIVSLKQHVAIDTQCTFTKSPPDPPAPLINWVLNACSSMFACGVPMKEILFTFISIPLSPHTHFFELLCAFALTLTHVDFCAITAGYIRSFDSQFLLKGLVQMILFPQQHR